VVCTEDDVNDNGCEVTYVTQSDPKGINTLHCTVGVMLYFHFMSPGSHTVFA